MRRRLNNKGATAIEYGLIAALVSIAGVIGMDAMGIQILSTFQTVDFIFHQSQQAQCTSGAGGAC